MKAPKTPLSLIILALLLVGCVSTQDSTQPTTKDPTSVPEVFPFADSVTPAPAGTLALPDPTGRITVLAATSLTEAFAEIGNLFEDQNPGVTVEFSFGNAQQLAQQIQQDAPADVFASASKKYMDAVIESGKVTADTQKVFVENKLVAIVPSSNPADVESLLDLAKPNTKLVLGAKEIPVGQYTLEFLAKASADPAFGSEYDKKVLNNVVSYEDTVKSVLAKVLLGEADGGIVYYSDVTGDAKDQVRMIVIPDEMNTVAKYPIAAINTSKEPELAANFIEFILSPAGQDILAKYGFITAGVK